MTDKERGFLDSRVPCNPLQLSIVGERKILSLTIPNIVHSLLTTHRDAILSGRAGQPQDFDSGQNGPGGMIVRATMEPRTREMSGGAQRIPLVILCREEHGIEKEGRASPAERNGCLIEDRRGYGYP